jgi:hypothetical protein
VDRKRDARLPSGAGYDLAHGQVSLGRLAALLTGVLFGTGGRKAAGDPPNRNRKKRVPAVTGFSLGLRVER